MICPIHIHLDGDGAVSSLAVDGATIPGVKGAIALNPGIAKSSGSAWAVRPRDRGRGVPDLSLVFMPAGVNRGRAEAEAIRLLADLPGVPAEAVVAVAAGAGLRDLAEGLRLIGPGTNVTPGLAAAWELSLPLAVEPVAP
ncbi:hypothetical protein DXC81_08205 [Collinsella tanakaei]|uniref:Uncharacterized protein n=1 Tax=Collinsella tanakaei TaxID=626935 RepID=A0A3E4QQZ8_9ACTN|nr:hypothetical protein [Collinsella tanakaei]RGL09565.1 hypothetical protein DXC81_08205 [Collinsella tanakaei]